MSDFENYLVSIGKSVKTAKNYVGAISGPISRWVVENDLSKTPLVEIDDVVEFERIATETRKLPIYLERNSVGKGMYNAALNSYSTYLADGKGVYLEQDICEILTDESITETEKQSLVNTRIGQGQFRSDLLAYWKGCAATGYRHSRLLVASHIKPWRFSSSEERLDVFNGLLLTPNLDKAFDLGYISFQKSGKICVSNELENPEVLGVTADLFIDFQSRHLPYLEHHLEVTFKY
jgi:hypothetical protein